MNQFDSHIQEIKRVNFHPKLSCLKVNQQKHMLLYGPPRSGKYSQALWYLHSQSPSELKYERRMTVTCDKEQHHIRVSDIHYEVDMDMLSKTMWHELYVNICHSISAKQSKWGVIMCYNFQETNAELMDVFYSYIQHNCTEPIHVTFIIITCDMCVVPDAVVDICQLVRIPRPSVHRKPDKLHYALCNTIVNQLTNTSLHKPFPFAELREQLYQLSVYQLHLPTCIWYIIEKLQFTDKQLESVMEHVLSFFKLYNNNCHPIYHLERLIFNMLETLHGVNHFEST